MMGSDEHHRSQNGIVTGVGTTTTAASESPAEIAASDRCAPQPHHRPSSGAMKLPGPPESDVMTVEEGAALLRIGRNALYDAIGRGEVPHRRIGRTIRLSRAALVRWLEGSCGAASTRGQ